MSEQDLSRLEHQIGRVLRVGVLASAILLAAGLVLSLAGSGAANEVLAVGLVVLMAIPVTRIAASFGDALRRHDHLLAWATAIVLSVMATTIAYQFLAGL